MSEPEEFLMGFDGPDRCPECGGIEWVEVVEDGETFWECDGCGYPN